MARTGKKTILLQTGSVEELEEIIEFAQNRAEIAGIRLSIDYTHDVGLKLSIAGPRDKINLYEHQLREFAAFDEEE